LKNEIIIKVLDRASSFLDHEQVRELRSIMEEELNNYTMTRDCMALALTNNLPDMVKLFLATKKLDGMSLKTIKNYYMILRKLAEAIPKDVDKLTVMDLRVYLSQRQKTGIKNSTLASIIWCLKSFFSWLNDESYVPKNPMSTIKATKTEKRVRKPLSQEELEILRIACKTTREKALVEFFYSTGARLDEVYKLDKSDIDWHKNSLLVYGKGSKERMVYLTAKARVYLWLYFGSRKDNNEALFVTDTKPHGRLEKRSIEEVFKKLGNKAGIKKHIYPHLLRHTFASAMLDGGAAITDIQALLGHYSLATTQIYCEINQEDVQMSHKKHLA
jgi:integrase/recombinase XerD